MELYAWKPAGQDWRFSLIFGTNRTKRLAEITSPEYTVVGMNDLKRKLSALAVGEWVTLSNSPGLIDERDRRAWSNLARESVTPEMVRDLSDYCTSLGIKLQAP